jgi:cytochrome bd-type quinol oxidase subunit 1
MMNSLFMPIPNFLSQLAINTYRSQVGDLNDVVPSQDQLCDGGVCPGGIDGNFVNADMNDVLNLVIRITNSFSYIIVGIAALFIVYAGFLIVTDGGSGKRAEQGKTVLFNAIIGMIVAILAVSIVYIVSQTVAGDLISQVSEF